MPDKRLLFGPLAAALLVPGVAGLAFMVPGYSQIRQTVSEIGEMDSAARIPFALMLCGVAVCLLIFAAGVRSASKHAGVGIFAFPHPLHNVFGEAELIGYQAPLAFALAWRADPTARRLVTFSWILFALVWISIVLNLSSLLRQAALWREIKPFYGLVQRSLFATWFGWCAGIGMLLWQRRAPLPRP